MDNPTPLKSRGLTWIRKSKQANQTTEIIHTVTTGRRFYLIHSMVYYTHFNAGSHEAYIALRNGADTEQVRLILAGGADSNEGGSFSHPYPIPLEVPSGWDITITANAHSYGFGHIIGWEE